MGEPADDGDPCALEEVALDGLPARPEQRHRVPVGVLRALLTGPLVVRGSHAEGEDRLPAGREAELSIPAQMAAHGNHR